MQTVILGAGISGLSAALTLRQHLGAPCEIYEKCSEPGGLCRTQTRNGFTFDEVSHVLHFRTPEGKKVVLEVLGEKLERYERNSSIYFRGRYVPYPFQAHLGHLAPAERFRCLAGFAVVWCRRKLGIENNADNFETWIHQSFGKEISRLFMEPYNTKLWGVAPGELQLDWVRPFVPSTSMRQVLGSLLGSSNHSVGFNSWFYYPRRGGMQALVKGFKDRIGSLELGESMDWVDLEKKVVHFESGREVRYDRLISTIPLRSLAESLTGLPARLRHGSGQLRCTTMLNLIFCLQKKLSNSYHWVYFPQEEFPFFRLVFPSNISSSLAPPGCSIISAEVSNPDMGQIEHLESNIKENLLALGLIHSFSDIQFTERNYLAHAYPLHDSLRSSSVQQLQTYLRSKDVWSIGRFGAWRYSSIDDAVAEAFRTVHEMVESPLQMGSRWT